MPIVNPWIIYGISVIDNLCLLAILALIITSVGMIVVTGGIDTHGSSKQDIKILKTLFVIFSVSVVLLVILPSKNTMLTMLALQYVTPDNIQMVQGDIVDFVNQVAQAVKSAK